MAASRTPPPGISLRLLFLFGVMLGCVLLSSGCESQDDVDLSSPAASVALSRNDVEILVTQAVEQAERLGEHVVIAVTDREGNVLAGFAMNGAPSQPCLQSLPAFYQPPTALDEAIQKARTAAFLSSNQNGFTTLTACFITQNHFPPEATNLPGGPLFGVGFSNLKNSDIQPRASGLTGAPGGVPVYKNGILAGGLGITGGSNCGTFPECLCSCTLADEGIALGGVIGFAVPEEMRGDGIFLDGIRLLFANTATPSGGFTLTPADLAARGNYDVNFNPRATPAARIPLQGEVVLPAVVDDPARDFHIHGSANPGGLTAGDVQLIVDQAKAQAARTRAAIRKPIGSPAQVFITVVDLDGSVLGMWRTPDATLFSMDVSAQKARTAVAFSNPTCTAPDCNSGEWLGAQIRSTLGLSSSAPLAMTTRAVGFLSQDFYPPGIDEETLDQAVKQGPFFGVQARVGQTSAYSGLGPFGNGLTIFPGGIPLYKNGSLVGAIGVSGDGVDQDDLIAAAGATSFEPPTNIRSDHFFFDGIRLPYVKFPRQAELGS